jgi:hypothetical protein
MIDTRGEFALGLEELSIRTQIITGIYESQAFNE